MKKDHHYVPRLILRKFEKNLNTFDLKTGEVKRSGSKLNETFSSDFLYSQEIENLFNKKIESEFANILNNKLLLSDQEITLTRLELNTVKKFLLLAMIRTLDGEDFMQYRKTAASLHVKETLNFEEKNTEGISDFDYWMRTMKCILESSDLISVPNHPEATIQAVRWAHTFHSGYIAFWDSTESNEDFIVIDNGMTSEHEVTRFMKEFSDDIIKKGYLIDKLVFSNTKSDEALILERIFYFKTLLSTDFFHENFYLFSVSKNRMIALINPFFRLYDKNDYELTNPLPSPDFWPSRISDRTLFLKNRNSYVNRDETILNGRTNKDDLYIYDVKQMALEDVIYVNCLCFDRVSNIVGFTDPSKIIRSLSTYSIIKGRNDNYAF